MFEDAELGHTLSKATFDRQIERVRTALLEAQYALKESNAFSVIVLMTGVEGGGRSETVNALTSWMDPRHVEVNGLGDPSDEEIERPRFWRFWRVLPPRGKIGIFFGSWYTYPIARSALGRKRQWGKLDRRISEINRFEQMLANERTLILKFWFHLSRKALRKRQKELKKSALHRWRLTDRDRNFLKHYGEFREVAEHTLRDTSQPHAPWLIVEGADRRYREMFVVRELLEAVKARLAAPAVKASLPATPDTSSAVDDKRTVLSQLDLTKRLTKDEYENELERAQGALALLSRHRRFKDHSVVIVFEGNDAAGKGGTIRRVTGAFDSRIVRPPQPHRRLRSLVVRPRARRARGGTLLDRRLAARLQRNQRLRRGDDRPRDRRGQVLAGHEQRGAVEALQRARARLLQALQNHARGLAQPQEMERVLRRGLRHGGAHVDEPRAVDAGRGERQVLCADKGTENPA